MSEAAAIICTRNRPDALQNTLESIASQNGSPLSTLIVVDGSDDPTYRKNTSIERKFDSLSILHHRYEGPPSAARQRNMGLDLLPVSVDQVFFFDDDITLRDDCLYHLASALDSFPSLSGVGASEAPESSTTSTFRSAFWKYLFLIDHPSPGQVLPSGHISPYYALDPDTELISTQWLTTCCCLYDREILDEIRFDDALSGALLEDLDLSYRIAQISDLGVTPQAQFIHHRSEINRREVWEYAYDRTIQRYWFVKKNMDRPVCRLAFWWSIVGKVLARTFSRHPDSRSSLQGLLRGVQAIWNRSHPLLRLKD
jgi:GT2 family glycosyltransferase